jgi:hypothetical protein
VVLLAVRGMSSMAHLKDLVRRHVLRKEASPRPDPRAPILAVGTSHLAAVQGAARQNGGGARIAFAQLRDTRYRGALVRAPDGAPSLSWRLAEDVGERSRELIVSLIGGNKHNILGLLNHPRPFDFVLPEEPDLPFTPGAECVPVDLVADSLAKRAANELDLLRLLRKATTVPMVHMESPPPNPSVDHIRRHPGVFKDRIDELGVAPVHLRYKLWRVHSSVVRSACAEAGIGFVPVPREAMDAQSMLLEPAWADDPTHGSTWYGALVLKQILDAAGGRKTA